MTESAAPRDWARTHRVTPAIHAVRGVGALGAALILSLAQQGGGPEASGPPPWILPAALLGALPVVLALTYVSWRVNTFKVTVDAVHQRKGLLFRQQRQARLDRLQAVDVVQPLLARVFGFAELKIEVAGGRESSVKISYLTVENAEAVRNEVLALAAGVKAARPSTATAGVTSPVTVGTEALAAPVGSPHRFEAAQEREVYRVRGGRLVGSILLSWGTFAIGIIAILTVIATTEVASFGTGADVSGGGQGLLGGIIAISSLGAAVWAQLNNSANFIASVSADGIRLSHGLLDTRRQTVPPGRVQALAVKQSLLWRRLDWWKVTLNVAGYGDEQESVSTLLPVGTRREALAAMWLVLPDLGDPDPAGTVSAAMSGKGSDNGFTASPRRSWVFDLFQWRQRGVKATDRALLIRRGLFFREFFVIPHERTQSLAIRQGPLQRRLRLATIEVHSTKGPVRPVAAHLDLDDAIALIEDQARRAREGRTRQTPEQWMAAISG